MLEFQKWLDENWEKPQQNGIKTESHNIIAMVIQTTEQMSLWKNVNNAKNLYGKLMKIQKNI